MERVIDSRLLDRIEEKLRNAKWVGGLSVVIASRTLPVIEQKSGKDIEKYVFDLSIRNQQGQVVGRLDVTYYVKPISLIKLGLIRVEPKFRNDQEHYGKLIMQNLQIFIDNGIGYLSDHTDLILDKNGEDYDLISQPYLRDFYEKLGWLKLFPNPVIDNLKRKKIFSKNKLTVRKIMEIQGLVLDGII